MLIKENHDRWITEESIFKLFIKQGNINSEFLCIWIYPMFLYFFFVSCIYLYTLFPLRPSKKGVCLQLSGCLPWLWWPPPPISLWGKCYSPAAFSLVSSYTETPRFSSLPSSSASSSPKLRGGAPCWLICSSTWLQMNQSSHRGPRLLTACLCTGLCTQPACSALPLHKSGSSVFSTLAHFIFSTKTLLLTWAHARYDLLCTSVIYLVSEPFNYYFICLKQTLPSDSPLILAPHLSLQIQFG